MAENNLKNNNLNLISIEDEMKKSYLDYAMSVIVSRAIPNVCDGLKPVHRRIIYAMNESGYHFNRPYKKSARIVGEVMGKYHPHGDSAIYDSLVRMAQDFSMRLPLIDGQGNFGSMDGDSAAAMRYTESRMSEAAHFLIEDIDKDTVKFVDNYDGSEREPEVLPARFPNLLVNGTGGIAVGMATNIPPHNLGEVLDACIAYIDDENITLEGLEQYILGPDFPTGGIILGKAGVKLALSTGRGSVIMRGKSTIESDTNGKEAIIITELPYQVNKAKMIEKIAELVRDKKIEGITDLRDESDKSGVRVVIELKKGTYSEVILNQLYSYTPLQTSFGVNMLALNNGRPQQMNVLDVITNFIKFRESVVNKRTNFLLTKARNKAHILIGLTLAVDSIDEVISIIRSSKDTSEAREKLLEKSWNAGGVMSLIKLVDDNETRVEQDGRCSFSDRQVRAILEMRLARLTGLERDKIEGELRELGEEIEGYLKILANRDMLMDIIKQEFLEVKEKFATPRKTQIEESEFERDIEDLIAKEDMLVTVTLGGYIKRMPLSLYKAQKRGGKGKSGTKLNEEDVVTELFIADTHTPILFFSNYGKVYKIKNYKLPLASSNSKGRAMVNIFPLEEGENITTVVPLNYQAEDLEKLNLIFSTKSGNIRKSDMSDFLYVPSNGKIAMKLDDGDKMVSVKPCFDNDHIMISAKSGKAVRFPVDTIRVIKSRSSTGVRGIKLSNKDEVVSMSILKGSRISMEDRERYLKIPLEQRKTIAKLDQDENRDELSSLIANIKNEIAEITLSDADIKTLANDEEFILSITENGFGKRSSAYEYRVTNRGGQGIVNIVTSSRNGAVVASFTVTDTDEIMMITDKGKLIRFKASDIRVAGRNTQGVTLLRTAESEKVVSVAKIENDNDEYDDAESDSDETDGIFNATDQINLGSGNNNDSDVE